MPDAAPWIFLTGENGMGKTVLLQALALGFNPQSKIININNGDPFDSSFKILVSTYENMVYETKLLNPSEWEIMPYLSCYGPSRLQVLTENDQNEKIGYLPGLNRLFGNHTFLKNIDFELIMWELKAGFEGTSHEMKVVFQQKIAFTKRLFIEMLDIKGVEIDIAENIVWYLEKGTDKSTLKKVRRNDLGAGYRNLIGLVGDMIINLSINQGIVNPSDLCGVVLIDEIELHLHPKWQKSLPAILSKFFPKIQFIASTHSPLPIMGAPENSVILKVDRTAENGIEVKRLKKVEQDLKYLLPNAVYSSDIFGLSDFASNDGVEMDKIL